jgi:hypothetical protein
VKEIRGNKPVTIRDVQSLLENISLVLPEKICYFCAEVVRRKNSGGACAMAEIIENGGGGK